ncbi:MAG: glutamate synthase subunit beta [Alphaproteobacteria bacterium]|jgi:glutamate synthase (NADPH) small chain|nr:glutamate synthase subunit beta [Alphaproteobacteria bacterium]
MGKPTGFLELDRADRAYRPVDERLSHYKEFVEPLSEAEVQAQGARCMDCGIPFCHNGCPVNNQIPDWNDLVYDGQWQKALLNLHSTNNFPEFTGRICPAPCEESCVLNINDDAVAIKTIECAIIDKGFENGWVKPEVPDTKTGKRVAIVGSGPAGMAAAQQLARAGHDVVLFEKESRIGGLLRYGIPDFKMEKHLIDRRMEQMAAEGVEFRTNVNIGVDVKAADLVAEFDAVALTGGAEFPRDLPVTGRDLDGVHFAMEFLPQQNKRNAGDTIPDDISIRADGKKVLVIGGGDTGSDCIGTSNRHGAISVTQLEIMPEPPETEDKQLVWPDWPIKMRTSSSHQEGAERHFAASTMEFKGENGKVKQATISEVEWTAQGPKPIAGTEKTVDCDLVLLAMGFTGPVQDGMVTELGLDLDPRGNVFADDFSYKTSMDKVYTAGDMRRGQSLVVWAIREGRQCARAIDLELMGATELPR